MPTVIDPSVIQYVNNCVLVGNAFKQYHDLLPDAIRNLQCLDFDYPNAKNILYLALSGKYAKLKARNATLLYLRNKVALNLQEQSQLKR